MPLLAGRGVAEPVTEQVVVLLDEHRFADPRPRGLVGADAAQVDLAAEQAAAR
jgi:hypothetical protein